MRGVKGGSEAATCGLPVSGGWSWGWSWGWSYQVIVIHHAVSHIRGTDRVRRAPVRGDHAAQHRQTLPVRARGHAPSQVAAAHGTARHHVQLEHACHQLRFGGQRLGRVTQRAPAGRDHAAQGHRARPGQTTNCSNNYNVEKATENVACLWESLGWIAPREFSIPGAGDVPSWIQIHSIVSSTLRPSLEVWVVLQRIESQAGPNEPESNPRHDQEHQPTDCQLCTFTGQNVLVRVSEVGR